MQALSKALKTILNGLAMQYVGDYLTEDEKKANLTQALAKAAETEKAVKTTPTNTAFVSEVITATK